MFSGTIGWKSLALVCRSLSTMLHSGIDVRKAFTLAAKRTGDVRCSNALKSIADAINRGQDVSTAMESQDPAFPGLMVDMVKVAEQTGALPEILEGLADHYDNNVRLRKAFLGQITWPLIQLTAAVLIIALLILILGLISDKGTGVNIDFLGFGLKGEKGALIWLGSVGAVVVSGFVLLKLIQKSLLARTIVDPILMKIPILGTCLQSFALARFSWAFYLTQQTGMPIHRSLAASLRATANGAFIAATPIVTDAVKAGESLSDALALPGLFPEEFLHMVHVGESSGTVPETLHRLSPQFEDQARRSLSVLTSALAWGVWLMVAGFIIFIIFRVFSWYTGMLHDALQSIG